MIPTSRCQSMCDLLLIIFIILLSNCVTMLYIRMGYNISRWIIMNKLNYDEVIARIGYFRNRANLSARETSFRLNKGELYLTRIENKQVELKVSTLLELFDVFGITAQDFFYLGKSYNEEDKSVLDLFNSLTDENKSFAVDFLKKLK